MEKSVSKLANQLQEARTRNLEQIEKSALRAHGKLWGMDVFSWINPKPAVLAATMDSFPFPIFWISSSPERKEVLEVNVELNAKIHFSALIDDEKLSKEKYFLYNGVVVSSLNEAFDKINNLKIKPSILLFTYSKSDWEYQKNRFNDYLSMAQVK